jgi:hypothetical protein
MCWKISTSNWRLIAELFHWVGRDGLHTWRKLQGVKRSWDGEKNPSNSRHRHFLRSPSFKPKQKMRFRFSNPVAWRFWQALPQRELVATLLVHERANTVQRKCARCGPVSKFSLPRQETTDLCGQDIAGLLRWGLRTKGIVANHQTVGCSS